MTDSTPTPTAPARPKRWRRLRLILRAGAIPGLAVGYALLVVFPGLIFAHELDHGLYRVQSDRPIDPAIHQVLDRADALLARSSLHDPSLVHHLYLAADAPRMAFLAPTSWRAFGATFPLTGHTILGRTDIPADLAFSRTESHNERPLHAVIAHERTHTLLNQHFGRLAIAASPSWKVEGYCDYVAGGTSFDPAEGRRLIQEGRSHPSRSFAYFEAALWVRYLLEVERITVDQLFARSFETDHLRAQVRAQIDRL